MMKMDTKNLLRTGLAVIVGNALYAFAVTFFVAPSGLILGGFTGLSIAISHFINIKVSLAVFVFHAAAFIAGSIVLGKKFAVSTAASTFLYPLMLNITEYAAEKIDLPFFHNTALNALTAALMIGVALGILTANNTSTGGTEVIPLIINKLTGKSIGAALFILDGAIMLIQLVYSDFTLIFYGIATVLLYSAVVQLFNLRRKKADDT